MSAQQPKLRWTEKLRRIFSRAECELDLGFAYIGPIDPQDPPHLPQKQKVLFARNVPFPDAENYVMPSTYIPVIVCGEIPRDFSVQSRSLVLVEPLRPKNLERSQAVLVTIRRKDGINYDALRAVKDVTPEAATFTTIAPGDAARRLSPIEHKNEDLKGKVAFFIPPGDPLYQKYLYGPVGMALLGDSAMTLEA